MPLQDFVSFLQINSDSPVIIINHHIIRQIRCLRCSTKSQVLIIPKYSEGLCITIGSPPNSHHPGQVNSKITTKQIPKSTPTNNPISQVIVHREAWYHDQDHRSKSNLLRTMQTYPALIPTRITYINPNLMSNGYSYLLPQSHDPTNTRSHNPPRPQIIPRSH